MTEDEEQMIKALQQFSVAPVVMLETWITENTQLIANGATTPYARGYAAPRLEIQVSLMRMYEDGLLDYNLREVKREDAVKQA